MGDDSYTKSLSSELKTLLCMEMLALWETKWFYQRHEYLYSLN